jgi:hypothetical protein
MELVDEADLESRRMRVRPCRRAAAVGCPLTLDLAAVGLLEEAGGMQQGGLAGAGRRDSATISPGQMSVGPLEDFERPSPSG